MNREAPQPLSLSQLEARSGYSRRALQRAFQQRFGCGPMQWLHRRRLELALERRSCAGATNSVTTIARECGYLRFGLLVCKVRASRRTTPLVGLALLHLSSDLEPKSETLARRAGFFARLAVPIALGFLLLIPLQGYLLWQQSSTAASGATNQLARQERTIATLREVVQQAGSVAELQQRLSTLQGPTLGPAEKALPLGQIKNQLSVVLEQADRALQRRRAELPKADPLNLISLALRNGFACLALAIGFAALGQRRRSPGPLLMEWQNGLSRLRFRHRKRSGDRGQSRDFDYLSRIRDREG